MQTIREWLEKKETELRLQNIFNGAGTITLKETQEKISTNGALQDLEDYLDTNNIEYITYLN